MALANEDGQTCSKNHTELTFAQAGPEGRAGAQGLQGIQGLQGPEGAQGPEGPAGSSGVTRYEIVEAQTSLDQQAVKSIHAYCPVGKKPVGGGASIFPSTADGNRNLAPIVLKSSFPNFGNGWFVRAAKIAEYGFDWRLDAYAVCVNVD